VLKVCIKIKIELEFF